MSYYDEDNILFPSYNVGKSRTFWPTTDVSQALMLPASACSHTSAVSILYTSSLLGVCMFSLFASQTKGMHVLEITPASPRQWSLGEARHFSCPFVYKVVKEKLSLWDHFSMTLINLVGQSLCTWAIKCEKFFQYQCPVHTVLSVLWSILVGNIFRKCFRF